MDILCDWCIRAMEFFSAKTGLSYSTVNILLFVILEPLAIVLFSLFTILALAKCKIWAIIVSILGVLVVLSVLIPSVYSLISTI